MKTTTTNLSASKGFFFVSVEQLRWVWPHHRSSCVVYILYSACLAAVYRVFVAVLLLSNALLYNGSAGGKDVTTQTLRFHIPRLQKNMSNAFACVVWFVVRQNQLNGVFFYLQWSEVKKRSVQVLVRFLCEEENREKRQGACEAKRLDSTARSLVSMTQNSEQKQSGSDDLNEIFQHWVSYWN